LGAVFLWRKPAAAFANSIPADASREAFVGARKAKNNAPSPQQPAVDVRDPVENTSQQVQASLNGLKDSLFRLELRHQAGTISDDQYARERARLEQILRDLVKG
jgi:hypothetical protein